MMKRIFLLSAIALFSIAASAQNLKVPVASPAQTVKQEFGLSFIEVSYARPAAKGRTVMGDLVPYGKVWRTGANAATTITFGDDVTFGGTKVTAGKYGLLSIPGAAEWTIILTKQLNVTSPSAYKQSEDVVRVNVKAHKLAGVQVESFLIGFDNVLPTSTDLLIIWENTAVIVPITTSIDAKVTAEIQSLEGKENFPYFQAAAYYLENNKDLNKALGWFNKATEQNKEAFWIWYQKAQCEAKLGKKADAKASAQKSLELATTAKNDDYVALNKKLIAGL